MNMAIDEAILRAVAAGLAPATLRFYAWQPACVSLGQAQSFNDVDWEACAFLIEWPVTRGDGDVGFGKTGGTGDHVAGFALITADEFFARP